MVPDLARMSVIIKSQHETSVMTGNYEMGYACGLLCKLAGREVPQWETPVELKDRVAELLTGYEPANEREKNVIHMPVSYTHLVRTKVLTKTIISLFGEVLQRLTKVLMSHIL